MKTLEIRLRSAMILWAVNTSMNLIFSDSFVLFFQCHMMFLAVIKDMSILYTSFYSPRFPYVTKPPLPYLETTKPWESVTNLRRTGSRIFSV